MTSAIVSGLQKIREKQRQGLLMNWAYDRVTGTLLRVGVLVEVSVTYLEGTTEIAPPQPRLANLNWAVATSTDLTELASLRGDAASKEEFPGRLARGGKCYFLRHEGRIVAFIWCEIGGAPRPRFGLSFGPRDAYVFDAYAPPSHRGLNLLPYLKYQVLQHLKHQGCEHVWTATDIFNGAAQRYKRKLGARALTAQFYVKFLGRFERLFVLYRFRSAPIPSNLHGSLPPEMQVESQG